jgi:hypothetical protein
MNADDPGTSPTMTALTDSRTRTLATSLGVALGVIFGRKVYPLPGWASLADAM